MPRSTDESLKKVDTLLEYIIDIIEKRQDELKTMPPSQAAEIRSKLAAAKALLKKSSK